MTKALNDSTSPDPVISVIIPVFNTEEYLGRCVESILSQTFNNLELILVDDGSSDNSGAICDLYAKRDPRVIVRHRVNGGVSSARNEGIALARGRFLSFVDSDDYIQDNCYQKLLDAALEEEADIVFSDYYEVYKEQSLTLFQSFNPGDNWHDTISNLISYGPHAGNPWNYLLINSDIIRKNHLFFPKKYALGEDFWFGLKVHVFSKKSLKVNAPLYYYNMENQNSLTHKEGLDSSFIKWNCLCESYSFLKEQGIFNEFEKEISWRMLLAKTPWVMSPSTFKYYYSLLPEVNSFVDNNPLLGKKMKYLMRLLNNNHKFFAALLSLSYSVKNYLFHERN